MYRIAIDKLYKWKNSKRRKPLIIEGARQVGKTWLMKEFGRQAYDNVAYINFDSNPRMKDLFASDLNTDRLIMGLELYVGHKIDPKKTLLIFDEVQEVPRALTSLKYFYENAPQYHIICAISFSGIALKQYYFIGGMPEAVQSFIDDQDFKEVRAIQSRILASYEQDFSKHAPNELVPKIRMLWNSIPSQLAKENKKFIYGFIREGARAREYETAIMWLSDCGLIHKISRVNAAGFPLKAYEDLKAFKLFMVDVGLLACMAGLSEQVLLDGSSLFVEFKGALSEQYVCQQLKTIEDLGVYYYTNDRGSCEIDFVTAAKDKVVPVEVKAETNLKAKSLKTFQEKYDPKLSIRVSLADYKKEDRLLNLPLYAIENIEAECIDQ